MSKDTVRERFEKATGLRPKAPSHFIAMQEWKDYRLKYAERFNEWLINDYLETEMEGMIKLSDLKPYRFTEKELKEFLKPYVKLKDVVAIIDEIFGDFWDGCEKDKVTNVRSDYDKCLNDGCGRNLCPRDLKLELKTNLSNLTKGGK